MLGALAVGESVIEGLLEGEDLLATAAAMRAMGASAERTGDGMWWVNGVGVGGLLQPHTAPGMGKSGTSTRTLIVVSASHTLSTHPTGTDALIEQTRKKLLWEETGQVRSKRGGRQSNNKK